MTATEEKKEEEKVQEQAAETSEATLPSAEKQSANRFDALRPGMIVRVSQKIQEGEKERVQVFEGIILARRGGMGVSGTITVRKVSNGVGVERIFPVHLPTITDIKIVRETRARRAKLHYLRNPRAKKLKDVG